MKIIKSFKLFEGHISYSASYKDELDEIVSTVRDYLSELDFIDINNSCEIVYPTYHSSNRDLYIEVFLSKPPLNGETHGFKWNDVKDVIETIMDYLADFGFKPLDKEGTYYSEYPQNSVSTSGSARLGIKSKLIIRFSR